MKQKKSCSCANIKFPSLSCAIHSKLASETVKAPNAIRHRSKGVMPSSPEAELGKAKQTQSKYGFALMCLETWCSKGKKLFRVEKDLQCWKVTLISLLVKDHIIEEKSEDLQTAVDEAIKRFG